MVSRSVKWSKTFLADPARARRLMMIPVTTVRFMRSFIRLEQETQVHGLDEVETGLTWAVAHDIL